ncbi:MAG: polysaccharide pyruvyl transferase family protein [Thermogutta sp.]
MLIALEGGNFCNKGDELMLRCVASVLGKARPAVKLASRDLNPANHEKLAAMGVYYRRLWRPSIFRLQGTLGFWMLQRYGRLFGIVTDRDIDAVVDFGGFRFTDQWGERCVAYVRELEEAKRAGKRVVLLPQAFGPCEHQAVRDAVRRVLAVADLVFVRDESSLAYLGNVCSLGSNIAIAPDFTNLVHGAVPSDFEFPQRMGCIVPNYLVAEKSGSVTEDQYVAFLVACVRQLKKFGLEPVILLHTTSEGDRRVAEKVEESHHGAIPVITDSDPVRLKGIIAQCVVLIGSRYHALVHALSQGVPSLATAWSHKYRTLFQEFGCPECVVCVTDSDERIAERLAPLMEEPSRTNLIEVLKRTSEQRLRKTKAMWHTVGRTLGLDLSGALSESACDG